MKCQHLLVIETLHRYPASMFQPAEIVGMAQCAECGETMELEDVPEDANVEEIWQ